MDNPLLTIITPVYNGKRFIESCLLSVINQDCLVIEHCIVDGGSTDGTVDIIRKYAQKHNHIHWISENDNGQSSALNKGIAMAKGKIIGILNVDDFYEPGVFVRILEIFKACPNQSFVVGNCNVINDEEKIIYLNKPSRLSLINMLIGGQKNQFPYNPSSYFYHKSLHQKAGLYDENDHFTMDIDFILRILPLTHLQYVNETWGNFRYIKGTKTFQSKNNNVLEINKKKVMVAHIKKLPWFKQWWIKIIRFIFILKKPHYYANRLLECIRNPKEILYIISKITKTYQANRRPTILNWEKSSPCPVTRTEPSLAQIGHEVFVIGGFQDLNHVLNVVDVLDLKKGTWSSRFNTPPQMSQTHIGITSDTQRYIYCIAGQKGPQCHPATAECFVLDTHLKTWSIFLSIPSARYAPTVQIWNGRLHVLGGSKEDRSTPACDHWSISIDQGKALENEWRKELPIPRGGPHRASAIINNKFYVFGGEEGDVKAIAGDPNFKCDWNTPLEIIYGDTFSLESGSKVWQKNTSMPSPTTHAEACVLLNDRYVLLVGGNRQRWTLSDAIQIYDVKTDTWQMVNRLPHYMKTSAAYYDGWLYLVTGQYSKSSIDQSPGEVHNLVWRTKILPSIQK